MGETMNIYAPHGSKVRYANPHNGYEGDQALAKKYLRLGELYTVDETYVGGSYTTVFLVELPKIPFNSVMFEDVEGAYERGCTRLLANG